MLLEQIPAATPPLREASDRAGVFRIENTSTYLARTTRDRVAGAQAILDQHVTTAIDTGHGLLPRRQPGASQPERTTRAESLTGRARTFSWFLRSDGVAP